MKARIVLLKEEQEELRSRLVEIQKALDHLNYKIENYQTILKGKESKLFDEGRRISKKSEE